ncbi:MAG: hypothetical protein ACI38A_03555 [Candidatus Ornithomonoglobus sp.]
MDIYLSVNNRSEIMQIPVLPPSFTISKPQSTTVFETVSKGELQLIGTPKLKNMTITSFFPVEKNSGYSYIRNRSMWGWDYVNMLDDWIEKKLPIRLVISDTPINMVVAVKNFQYTIKTDGDLWYTVELEQFNLLGYENPQTEAEEEELNMSQYEELKSSLEYISGVVTELANPMRYNYIDDNMPEWAKEAVVAAINAGVLSGDSGWDLNYDNLRTLTWMHRAGLF